METMRAKLAAVLVGCTLLASTATAQQAADPTDWAREFLDTLMSKGADHASAMLNEETELGRRVRTAAPLFRDTMAKSIQANGTIINYELATQSKLGSRNQRLIYAVNHLRGATVYRMFFYRTDRGWDVVALQAETSALKFDFN